MLFAQLVNDPSWQWELEKPNSIPPNHLKASWAKSRKRLFAVLEDLVKWENTNNDQVLEKARSEIRRSWRETCELNKHHPRASELFNPEKLPALHDPFCGGGAIPLEAQRLGIEAFAGDLNPIPVVITKAMIEIPPRFAGCRPVGPLPQDEAATELQIPHDWPAATGLTEDVRRYGLWLREQALKRIGHLYPHATITASMAGQRPDLRMLVGQQLVVIAWIWARTVKSPNPAFRHVDVPLASTFILSSKAGREAYVEPLLDGDSYAFAVRVGKPPANAANGTKAAGRGANFRCLVSGSPIDGDYIKAEGRAGRLGARLMAMIAEGPRGRVYLPPTPEMEDVAHKATPRWVPTGSLPSRLTGGTCVPYGLKEWGDLFSPRQLVALTTLSDLVSEARDKACADARIAGMPNDDISLDAGGRGAKAYGEAVSVYLAFLVDQVANHSSTLCGWNHPNTQMRSVFSRQALPMTWDYAECNPFSGSSGSYANLFERQVKGMSALGLPVPGFAEQQDAQKQRLSLDKLISTDPPYYDNIAYADLSDFFYAWLRRILRPVFPSLFATVAVPKADELVATAYRHGGQDEAEKFFLNGMTEAMHAIATQAHPGAPITIYYAFKQSETATTAGTTSTGWETFLEAVHRAGLAVTGTWPMRTEKPGRVIGIGANALASSIILVCRPRPSDAPTISRRVLLRELNQVLPEALDEMTRGSGDERSPVAPVDLSQAIIGPGMAVFSKYSAVLEADGKPMSVRTALGLMNRFLAEDDFDHDTQFCLHWFGQHGWAEGKFGDADTLARAKGTSVDGVKQAGVLYASAGVVRILRWADYPTDWDPKPDARLPIWEALHQMIRIFKLDGEAGAGAVLAAIPTKAEATRQLAYRLYTLCERAGWAEDARAYNELIASWSAIESAAAKTLGPRQAVLDL